uniref:Kinesin motor domain-containing protein n=1 Tax=Macrostomum lignano TaxID=282301 RepID=A0A1I8F407_9PLAT
RLEQAYQLQSGQPPSAAARDPPWPDWDWENERLNTSRLLKSIRRCSSDERFLGPPTRKRARGKAQERQQPAAAPEFRSRTASSRDGRQAKNRLTAKRFATAQKPKPVSTPRYVERSKTFAAATTVAKAPAALRQLLQQLLEAGGASEHPLAD